MAESRIETRTRKELREVEVTEELVHLTMTRDEALHVQGLVGKVAWSGSTNPTEGVYTSLASTLMAGRFEADRDRVPNVYVIHDGRAERFQALSFQYGEGGVL